MPIISIYKKLFSPFNYQTLLFVFLAFIAVGLSLSPFITSIGGIGLSAVWLLSANFKQKLTYLKERKMIWPLLVLFLLHIIGLINTSNFNYAFHDIKIKLPLLAIPLVLGSSPQLPNKKITNLFAIFIAGIFISTLISTAVYLGFTNHPITNMREISIIISHIRLGLMVLFSIILLIYFYYKTNLFLSLQKKLLLISIISWFLLFIYILQSSTSWIIAIVILYFFLIKLQFEIKKNWAKLLIRVFLIVFPIGMAAFGIKVYTDFYHVKDDLTQLPKKTKYGNVYTNDTTNQLLENGHYVNIQVSIKELRDTWPTLSTIPLYGKDAKGQPMYGTLIRYLTSKGLTKDTDGLKSLSTEEIKMIESGVASCIYVQKSVFYIKVYEAIWEFDRYLNHDDPNAKSICMRVEYLKTAKYIISHNFWSGVGTGDVNDAYKLAYKETNSNLIEKYQRRTHNQYVTFFVTFGIFGFIASLFGFIAPYMAIKKRSILLTLFVIIIFLSMLNEDTLETQAGVTFFSFFYPLLLIYSANIENHG